MARRHPDCNQSADEESVLSLTIASLDSESNWLEGLKRVAVYEVMAIVFFFVPGS